MKPDNIFGIIHYLVGAIVNLIIMLLTVYFIFMFTQKAYDFGKGYTQGDSGSRPYREVEISISEGAKVDEVAKVLEEKGVIKSALMFKLESALKGKDDNFSAGTFKVNSKMTSDDINSTLRKKGALAVDVKATIREGFNTKEIGEYLESLGVVSKDDFINACNNGQFDYSFLNDIPNRENRLEGYLFPDTYFFRKNSKPEQVINKMLTRFEEIYTADYSLRAKELGFTTDQVITMASIIEKEIKKGDERGKAASVIYNRLDTDMPLQMCSTVLFVLDKRKDRLLEDDLKTESPYNTYINKGLPPGPISNPGKACIDAALFPDDSKYLYFVVKDEETGEHFFTENYDAFVNAKVQYNQKY